MVLTEVKRLLFNIIMLLYKVSTRIDFHTLPSKSEKDLFLYETYLRYPKR